MVTFTYVFVRSLLFAYFAILINYKQKSGYGKIYTNELIIRALRFDLRVRTALADGNISSVHFNLL